MTNPTLQQLKEEFENGLIWQHKKDYIWSWFEQKLSLVNQSGVRETVEEIEKMPTFSIKLDGKIFNKLIDKNWLLSHLSKKTEKI